MNEDPARELSVEDLRRFLGLDAQVADELTGYLDAAAVLAAFDPIALRPFGDAGPRAVIVDSLLPRCEPVTHGPAAGLWTLSLPDRRAALRRLGTRDRMRQALQVNPDRPEIALQAMLERVIDDRPIALLEAPRGELAALVTVCDWVTGILDQVPDKAEIIRSIDRLDLIAPLLRLTDGTFVGRSAELAQIRDYAFGRERVRTERLRASRPATPLFVYGPGGIGKSTLIARLLLDMVDDASVRTAYLNIDRPTISPDRPATLLIEVINQLQPQLEADARTLEALATELAYAVGREDAGRRSESASGYDPRMEQVASKLGPLLGQESPESGDPQVNRFAAVVRPLLADSVLLVVLDTFEEAQFLGYDVVWPLTRFLLRLTEKLPDLRLVLCGRTLPPEFVSLAFPRLPREAGSGQLEDVDLLDQIPLPSRPINLGVLEEEEARELLREFVAAAGQPTLPDDTLDDIINVVSRNPMCLRLAARVLADEGTGQLLAFPSEFLTRLRAEKIQALLYGRILGHLHADDVRSVAYPGLVVRRITPDVIRDVLAGPCALKLTPERDEHAIFSALGKEAALVQVDPEDGSLRHRADVRRAMLEDLTDQVPAAVVERIDRAAVSFYRNRSDPVSRAEEIYHRLRLREPTAELDVRWMPEVASHLKNAGEELPARERLWLARKLGITIDESARRTADQDAWEDQAARSADRFLGSNAPDDALQVLHERRARLPRSRLYLLEAEAYRLAGQPDRALQVARAGVTAVSKAGAIDMALELLLQMVVIEESRGTLEAAAALLGEVREVAEHSTDEVLRLRAAITGLRIHRKRQPGSSADDEELRRQALTGLSDELLRAVSQQPVLLREAVAELGGDNPRITATAVQALGIEISSDEQAEALAEAIKTLDAAQPHGVPLDRKFATGAEQFRRFQRTGFDAGAVRRWAAETLTDRDVRELIAVLDTRLPGDKVLRAFRDYFRAGVDDSLQRSVRDDGKWAALSVVSLGALATTISASSVLVALPAIFRSTRLNPLVLGNVGYLVWMLVVYLAAPTVLAVPLMRLGNRFGRVRVYKLGFAVFTVGALALALDPLEGSGGALWLIGWRILQAAGVSMLSANASPILTRRFPSSQRGTALGLLSVNTLAGGFLGLVLGGTLAAVNWRLVFWVLVPIGIFGTGWSQLVLRETETSTREDSDWLGGIFFAFGLSGLLAAAIFGIEPYGDHGMGWTSPWTLACLAGGLALLAVFCLVELRVPNPMIILSLMKIRPFRAGVAASLLASVATGGLPLVLVIWLQGIWLPVHGYNTSQIPLWCAIYLVPLSIGFLISGPVSGILSARYGLRLFASSGLLLWLAAFGGLLLLPVGSFSSATFCSAIFILGISSGLFASPIQAMIMNSVPPQRRGAAASTDAILRSSGTALSNVIYLSLLVAGLSTTLPAAWAAGLTAHGVPSAVAQQVARRAPTTDLFSAFLGYNPVSELLAPTGVLTRLSARSAATLTGSQFFPQVIAAPFRHGLLLIFIMVAVLLAAAISLSALAWSRRSGSDSPAPDQDTGGPPP